MKRTGYMLMFAILLVAQILLNIFFNFSQYLTLTFLPVMVLCLPTERSTIYALLTAFVTGFLANFLCDGMLGLTILALVPVAFFRKVIITLVFGSELIARGENISLRRQGAGKVILAILIATGLYLLIFIWADGAGTRPFFFNFTRFLLSWIASSAVSFFIADLLTSEDISR